MKFVKKGILSPLNILKKSTLHPFNRFTAFFNDKKHHTLSRVWFKLCCRQLRQATAWNNLLHGAFSDLAKDNHTYQLVG